MAAKSDTTDLTAKIAKAASDLSYEIADAVIDHVRGNFSHSYIRQKVYPICLRTIDKQRARGMIDGSRI